MLTPYSNHRTHWRRLFHFSNILHWGTQQQRKKLISLSSKTKPTTGNGLRMVNHSEPTTSMSHLQYREYETLKFTQQSPPAPRQPRKHILPPRLQHLRLWLQHLRPHRLNQRNQSLPPHASPRPQFLGRSRRHRRMERHCKLNQPPKTRHAAASTTGWNRAGVSGVGIQY